MIDVEILKNQFFLAAKDIDYSSIERFLYSNEFMSEFKLEGDKILGKCI